jgi:hypothetical protein
MPKEELLQNNERSWKSKTRFRNPYDLWQRFEEVSSASRKKKAERAKIIELYERKPFKRVKGKKVFYEPNWGTYTDAINDYIRFFSSIVLDRKIWCRIETHEGVEEGIDSLYSDYITEAFHKYCINTWEKREDDMISAIHDDCFFNKGCLVWECPVDTYPCHCPTEDIYPDTNATTDVCSFDILFVRKRFTAVELYQKATDPYEKELGWNTDATLKALSNNISSLKECDSKDIVDMFRRGGIEQLDQDKLIPVIYCYVREYKPYGDGEEEYSKDKKYGNRISLMIIPEELISMGISIDSVNENKKPLLKRKDYLQYSDYYASDFSEILHLITSNVKRAYYDSSSFANQIYQPCKFHDQTHNSVIRAVKRNMRLYMKTGNTDTRTRLESADPNDEVFALNQDDMLEQITLRQDIAPVSELLRGMKNSISAFSPVDFQGTQASPKGYPITKRETDVLATQLDDSKSNTIKLMISKDRLFCKEMVRRFLASTEDSDTWENFKRFKAEMKRKDVPPSAWKEGNYVVYPRFNQYAGRASANYASAQALLQATQIKPASKAEEKAKRNLIASLVLEPNVHEYEDLGIQMDQELFIIGQENESLDNPIATPENNPVTQTDNHFLHIPHHMQDYMAKLQFGSQLLQQAAQEQSYKKMFLVETAANIINAQDNKGAHIQAHFVVAQKDSTKQDELKQLADTFKKIQQQQDAIANTVRQVQEQLIQEGAQSNLKDQEFVHRQRMDALEYNNTKAMNNLDFEKKTMQIQSTQTNNDAKQSQKVTHTEQDQMLHVQENAADLAFDVEKKKLELEATRIKNRLSASKSNGKKPTKTTTGSSES